MKIIILPICLTFLMIAGPAEKNLRAQEIPSERLERERQKIIGSLSAPITTKKNCAMEPVWRDEFFANLKAYFFKPKLPQTSFSIGGFGTSDENTKMCVTIVQVNPYFRKEADKYLAHPRDWKMVWSNISENQGSFWKAIPPNVDFTCIGSVAQKGSQKPLYPEYRCLNNKLLKKFLTSTLVWSTEGSEVEDDEKVTVFKLPLSGSFVAVKGHEDTHEWYDINLNFSSKPEPELVDELLKKRVRIIREQIKTEEERKDRKTVQSPKAMAAKKEVKKPVAEDAKIKGQKKETKKRAVEEKRERVKQRTTTDNVNRGIQKHRKTKKEGLKKAEKRTIFGTIFFKIKKWYSSF